MATVTVDPNTSYQTFLGWEATSQAGEDYDATNDIYPTYPSPTYPNYKAAILAGMADVGINRLRVEISLSDVNAGSYDANFNTAAIQPSTATSGQWHYDRMRRTMDDLVIPYRNILAAQGEALYIALCVVDFRAAGYDAENDPNEYAFFVNKFVTEFYNVYGFLPDAIEAILEPGTGENTTNWTRAKVANNIVAARALLVSSGPTGAGSIPFVGPSIEDGSTLSSWMTDMSSANSAWEAIATLRSYHGYTRPSNAQLVTARTTANAQGANLAMLEHIGATHLELFDDLNSGHCAAWEQYTVDFPYPSATDNGEAYFQVNRTTWAVTIGNRTKYIRHFSKYIRRGSVMKGVSVAGTGSSNINAVVFRHTNGRYVVVANCAAAVSFDIASLPNGNYKVRYTTGDGSSAPSAYDQSLSDQVVAGGNTGTISMPGAGVITIYDEHLLDIPVVSGGRGARRLFFG